MRQMLWTWLALLALATIVSTADAQTYGRFGTPRSQHPRSTYGAYRSYPRNYAEYSYGGYNLGGWGYGFGYEYGWSGPGYGWSWGGYPVGPGRFPSGPGRSSFHGGYYR